MVSDGAAELTLGQKIFLKTAAPLLLWSKPEVPPVLGPDFVARVERTEEAISKHRMSILDWLKGQSTEDLAAKFNESGFATEGEAKKWQDNRYSIASNFVRDLRPMTAAALGAPRLMADFNHWSMAAFFKPEEVLWLSFGLEPTGEYNGKKVSAVSPSPEPDLTDIFVARRRELLRREFDPAGLGRRVESAELYAWVKRVGLEVHQGFERMLAKMLQPKPTHQIVDDSLQPDAVRDTRDPHWNRLFERHAYDPEVQRRK
jgi:hypothetical protein